MNFLSKILFYSFVKPFYKENAGAFVFVFTMMFCIVSKVDGAGIFEYHYSLVTGMLKSNIFLYLVMFIWFIYVRKYALFVSSVIFSSHYSFLQIYNQLNKTKQFWLFFIVEIWLLIPVLLYFLFICFVGFKQHQYFPVSLIVSYLLLLTILSTSLHVYQLNNLNKRLVFSLQKLVRKLQLTPSYHFTLIRFVSINQIIIFAGIKVFTCGVLYLIARNNNVTDYDISMPFLFYSFGILANGVLILRIRTFEETYLSFYRGLPVSLNMRLLQYSLIYLIFLVPEFVTAVILVPIHLYFQDAINFMLCGFSLLLLMNSITFLEDFKMKEYIKILFGIFFIECVFLMTIGFFFLFLFLFILAIIIFFKRYYKFEQNMS